MKIFGFHDSSACGYYRISLPLDAVAFYGKHDIQTSYGWNEEALKYPIIIGQRIGKEGAMKVWRRLRPGRRLIFEIDDDVFNIDPMNVFSSVEHKPEVLDSIEQAMTTAHTVTVSTSVLAEIARRYNPDVHVLPNCIDGKLLDVERPKRERLTIGWAGGTSHFTDWEVSAKHIGKFMQRNPKLDFHVIGTNFAGRTFGMNVRNTQWISHVWKYYYAIDFDIGIAPLAPIEFNRSKSHIKALEYAALGIPVVATDMEPYRDFVVHGETGYLVKHDYEWGRYLKLLTDDEDLRKEMGKKAKDLAADWTIQRRWKDWEQVWLGE